MTKIYVSSTYNDLMEHRQQVYDILCKMRYDVIAMEDYVAAEERPLDKCLADVASCDIYVGVFAWRYGYIPPGQERSITDLEYRWSRSGSGLVSSPEIQGGTNFNTKGVLTAAPVGV